MKLFTIPLLMGIFSLAALAFEPQNPIQTCDRFLGSEKEACEKDMQKRNPDWYLATVCGLQFEDKLFNECLQLGEKHSFSPIKLEACTASELNDLDRLQCVRSAQTSVADSFQGLKNSGSRQPASVGRARSQRSK